MATRTLTALERRMLAFEGEWEGRSAELKHAAVREVFAWRPVTYEQRLRVLLADPAALVAEPMLVRRALERRERAARGRASREFTHAS